MSCVGVSVVFVVVDVGVMDLNGCLLLVSCVGPCAIDWFDVLCLSFVRRVHRHCKCRRCFRLFAITLSALCHNWRIRDLVVVVVFWPLLSDISFAELH